MTIAHPQRDVIAFLALDHPYARTRRHHRCGEWTIAATARRA
jgi:hypothetical protein